MVLDVNFMTLTILKLNFSFIFLEFIVYLRASSKKIVKTPKNNVILLNLKKIQTITCSISLTCILVVLSSKICRFFLELFCHHYFLGFVDQYVLKMSIIFFFANLKLVYSFESLSLKDRHGSSSEGALYIMFENHVRS